MERNDYSHKWADLLEKLKQILDQTGLEIKTKWASDVYVYGKTNVLSYGAFKNYVALWFYDGALLSDPQKVLINAQENVTKALRQWRFTSVEEIDEKLIESYLNEAVANAKAGKTIKPAPFRQVAVPEFLQKTLDADNSLKKAFGALTPGRQKEYSVYIAEAKQDKTKFARIEKIKPMIINGIGLNDNYK
ncbi:MAG: YdeI/OmpD-associated family protein [Capnocytophaga sp.]|nr:YdeI/OmpD-associated family protein [Capnocytophaga sp.]